VSDTSIADDVCCSVPLFGDAIEQSGNVHATKTRRELRPAESCLKRAALGRDVISQLSCVLLLLLLRSERGLNEMQNTLPAY